MMWKVVPFALLSMLVQLGGSADEQPRSGVSDDVGTETQEARQEPAQPIRSPEECFPTAKGTRWEYTITLEGSAAPLWYEYVFWPGQDYNTASRSLLHSSPGSGDPGFRLVIEVKDDMVAEQGPLEYPQGIELEIVEDDLGIFRDYTHVYWAISSSRGYQVTQVVTKTPSEVGAPAGSTWGSRNLPEGYSLRLLVFEGDPGAMKSLNDEDDRLSFVGPDLDDQLHYQRWVLPSARAGAGDAFEGDKGFTEDMWFKRGVGLKRLEQRVDDEVRMTWELTGFTPGA